MAIYHCSIKIIKRSEGKVSRSSVASAAYRAGEKIQCKYDGLSHDYSRKRGIVYDEIVLPENAPEILKDRGTLWNSVETFEKNKKAQTAREVEIALPVELSLEENISMVRDFAQTNFVGKGMCADICIHDKRGGVPNPHAHIMLTMRPINPDGSWGAKSKKEYILDENGQKVYDKIKRSYKCYKVNATDWDSRDNAELWRSKWEDICNGRLAAAGVDEKIDRRSYERRGLYKLPTEHLGPYAATLEKQNKPSELGDRNRRIAALNARLDGISETIVKTEAHIINFASYKEQLVALKSDIDQSVKDVGSFDGFLAQMREKGYAVKQGMHLAFSPPNQDPVRARFIRSKIFGELYTESSLRMRIEREIRLEDVPVRNEVRIPGSETRNTEPPRHSGGQPSIIASLNEGRKQDGDIPKAEPTRHPGGKPSIIAELRGGRKQNGDIPKTEPTRHSGEKPSIIAALEGGQKLGTPGMESVPIGQSEYRERLAALKADIDMAISGSGSFNDFLLQMRERGHEVKQGKHIAFCPPGQDPGRARFIRSRMLGEQYTEDSLVLRIAQNLQPIPDETELSIFANVNKAIETRPASDVKLLIDVKNNVKALHSPAYRNWASKENLQRSVAALNYLADNGIWSYVQLDAAIAERGGTLFDAQQALKAIEGRIRALEQQAKQTDVYIKTKPTHDKYAAINSPAAKERFYKANESELRMYSAARDGLSRIAESAENGKASGASKLNREIANLQAERKGLQAAYSKAKDDFNDIGKVRKNIDTILALDTAKEKARGTSLA
jgi:hypothetical protein